MRHNDIRYTNFEVKSIDDAGTFEGFASVYGNRDETGDMVMPGAFKKTLSERPTVPVLWQHKDELVIGSGSLVDSPAGLLIKAQLDMEDPAAQHALRKMKLGLVKGLSIGYQVVKDAWEEGVRQLKEVKLYEVSVVTMPANEFATVTSVKAGRKISADSRMKIEAALQSLEALLEEAGAVGSDDPADATDKGADSMSTKPVTDHSALLLAVQKIARS